MARANLLFILLLAVLFSLVSSSNSINKNALTRTCPSEIYCYGKLLHQIQMAKIFPDSKTFVDMKMKQNSTQILKQFNELLMQKTCHPSVDDLKNFLAAHFEPAGSEFEEWEPSDWHASPKFLEKIDDRGLKKWAEQLHELWKHLGRKMKEDVYKNSNLYSIIPVPNPVIVPGGRFREFYYWDSYWIVRGLLYSEMYDTVKGMLNNFVSIVDRYGLIPNGGRIYYMMRSQPPLFIPMVDSYLEFTNDTEFLEKNIKSLEKEFLFWMKNRTIVVSKDGRNYTLCQYHDHTSGPRPESYREDVESAQFINKAEDKDRFYSELKSAAESGLDFSSRWFINDQGTNQGNLTDLKIKLIVPVDLNAIIYWNAKLLSKFFKILNRPKEAEVYEKISDKWLEAVDEILWHPEVGAWLDYDLLNKKKRDYVYPSNLSPLWTNCYPADKKNDYTDKVIKYIVKRKVLENLGGVPASLEHTGEQWDYPNAWPPHQYIIIMGLENANTTETKGLAFELAERWVQSNYKAYLPHKAMYEKYDATVVGGHGGGGEYEVQLGFGWSNGVILELLDRYGARLVGKERYDGAQQTSAMMNTGVTYSSNHFGPVFTLLLAFGATLTAGCIGAVVYAKRHSPWPDKSKYMKIPRASDL
uniref:Trehalase n=1 Tax=Panstrongylus lignarius TaxID=156445 RepID=A0A224X931_9HEMI